jgi:hypothetical protein
VVGRAEACVVRLASLKASAEHAVIFWNGARWAVRDLNSKNHTHVGGRLLRDDDLPLDPGVTLVFGDDAERWTLEDAGPPVASARSEATGEVRAAEDGLLALPDGGDPQVTLYEDVHGRWIVEIDGAARHAIDDERIDAGGLWTLRIPPPAGERLPPTATDVAPPKVLGAVLLRFEVSRDREYVGLSLVQGAEVVPLGGRVSHEVLLALARARLDDKRDGVDPAEQGWLYVDDLLDGHKLSLQHLNMHMFRARKALARAGLLDPGALVERRAMTRQIRLGTDVVEIVQL